MYDIYLSYEQCYAKLGIVSPMIDATRHHQCTGDGVQPLLHGGCHRAQRVDPASHRHGTQFHLEAYGCHSGTLMGVCVEGGGGVKDCNRRGNSQHDVNLINTSLFKTFSHSLKDFSFMHSKNMHNVSV